MKVKLYSLLPAFMLCLLVTKPACATLFTYTSSADLAATFVNDTSYIMDELNLKQLEGGSEWFTAIYNPDKLTDGGLVGADIFKIVFLSSNTTFGGKWYVPDGETANFTVFLENGDPQAYTLGPRLNPQGDVLPQFLAVRGDEGELISSVEVNLGTGVRMANLVHNQPVPEPETMLLLGMGLIGLAGIGRGKFFKK